MKMERMVYPNSNIVHPKFLIVFLLFTVFSFAQDQKINQFDADGNRHGLWKGTYEKSQRPRYEGVFQHGKETGIFQYFDDTKAGKVIATRDFSKDDGSCYAIFYDRKGNKVSEGLINKNRENEGEWKYYHQESPQIMSVKPIKTEKLKGLKKFFIKMEK